MYSLKNNLKFIIPSLIGIFIFICQIKNDNNEVTVPVAFIANKLVEFIYLFGENAISYIVSAIIVISTMFYLIYSYVVKSKSTLMNQLFNESFAWNIVRILGEVFGILVLFDIGPIQITS